MQHFLFCTLPSQESIRWRPAFNRWATQASLLATTARLTGPRSQRDLFQISVLLYWLTLRLREGSRDLPTRLHRLHRLERSQLHLR